MPYAVAVDIGGTFTDLVAYDNDGHRVVYAKSPTTYHNFVEGILDCFGKVKLEARTANFLNHGTTLVINSLIQRTGARTALVTTKGFRHALKIGYQARPKIFARKIEKPEILYERVVEIDERVRADGTVEREPDLVEARAALEQASADGIADSLRGFGDRERRRHHGGTGGRRRGAAVRDDLFELGPDLQRARRDLLHELLRQSGARGIRRGRIAPADAGGLCHLQHRGDARMV